MNIVFNKVILHNFMSFEDAEVSIEDGGIVVVEGKNNNEADGAKSNGSGKSTIFEAIVYALTGETIRGTKNVVREICDGGCYVDLNFTVDDARYRLIRSKNSKEYGTNLKIYKNGEDISGKGVRESQKIFEQLFPDLTPTLIGSVIVLGQGMPLRFSNNTPSGRKEVLETLSKSDFMIEDLKNKVSKRKDMLSSSYQDLSSKGSALLATKDSLESNIVLDEASIETYGEHEASNIQYRLDAELSEIKTLKDDLGKIKTKKKELNDKLNLCRERWVSLSKAEKEEKEAVENSYRGDISAVEGKLITAKADEQAVRKQIDDIKKIRDVCPTCGQKLAGVSKPSTKPLEEDLKIKSGIVKSLEEDVKSKRDILDKSLKQISAKYSSGMENEVSSANGIKEEIKEIEAQESRVSDSISDKETKAKSLEKQIAECSTAISVFKNRIEANKTKLAEVEEKIKYNLKERELHSKKLAVVNKFATMLSRDFRGYLLKDIIDFLNETAKGYSSIVFGNTLMSIELNGNNIDISFNGKGYEDLSGGERQKVDIIMQLSIRKMLCSYLNISANMLVLDEVFDSLDSVGCQKVIDLITSELSDIDTVFIVSHHASELNIPYDKKIMVVKDKSAVSKLYETI